MYDHQHLFSDIGRTLHTASYLYSPGSEILMAVAQSIRGLRLNLQDPEHIKFLMDISLQLTTYSHSPLLLAQAFKLEDYQLEEILYRSPNDTSWQVYRVLRTWLTKRYGLCTLGDFQDALSIKEVKLTSNLTDAKSDSPSISLVPSEFDTLPVQGGLLQGSTNDCFLVELSKKLQCCWKKVGSLMGMAKNTLDAVELENAQLHEQAYQMLLRLQKERGHAATYGVLFAAIQRLTELHPDIVNDAWCYCVHYLNRSVPFHHL